MPRFVKGVMNLRGKIIPLMDLQDRFGLTGIVSDASRRAVIAMFGDQFGSPCCSANGSHSSGPVEDFHLQASAPCRSRGSRTQGFS